MESQMKCEIPHCATNLPVGLPNHSPVDFYSNNFISPESCPQNFNSLHQFASINVPKQFDPFDGLLHSSLIPGLGLHGFKPYEEVATTMQGFHGVEFLNFSNSVDHVFMEDGMVLDGHKLEPIDFVIPDEGSSCVTNVNKAGRNGIKRNKSVNKNNIHNTRARSLSTKIATSRGSKNSKSMKGQWTIEEDKLLIRLVEIYGVQKWSHIAHMMKGRIGKQCRERWHNHLRPDIKKDQWTEEEDRILIEAHSQVGNKWAKIAESLPGRTENSIKNHWNATKRRQFSRRKCRTKWPKPSYILQNYIKSLYLESDKKSKNNTDIEPPSAPTAPKTLNDTSSNNGTGTGAVDFDLSHVDDNIGPKYDQLDDILDFTFDDFHALDGSCSMDSSLVDVPDDGLPLEVDEESCFDFDLPFDVASIIPM